MTKLDRILFSAEICVCALPHRLFREQELRFGTPHTASVLSRIERFAMISPALKPVPLHQGMAKLVLKLLRTELGQPLISQAHETKDLSHINVEDWNNLFHAVEARLCACVAADDLIDDKVRVTVLECVEALEQLHSALTFERQQFQTLKLREH